MKYLLVFLLAAVALGDSWMPYGERLATSGNGKRYLITRQFFQPRRVTFELCARKPDTAGPVKEGDKVKRGPDDTLLASGELKDPPLDVWVLSDKPAAVLFETYRHVGYGNSLARLDGDGKIRWVLKYRDLDLRGATVIPTVSSKWWHAGWWVEEEAGRVVLLANGGVVNLIDLETGKLTRGDATVVFGAMHNRSAAVRWVAFAVCPDDIEPKGWARRARATVKDRRWPASTRFAAAWALHLAGEGAPDRALFAEMAHDRIYGAEAMYRALEILKKDAIPILEAHAQRFPAQAPIYELSQLDALEPLVRLAKRTPGHHGMRVKAACAVANIDADRFVRLIRGDAWLAKAALGQYWMKNATVDAALAKALLAPGHGDETIARRLKKFPRPEYAAGLAAAQKRNPESAVIAAALGVCK